MEAVADLEPHREAESGQAAQTAKRQPGGSPLTIPWQFMWLVDVALLTLGFFIDYSVLPPIFDWLANTLSEWSSLWPRLIVPLLPLGERAELPPFSELAWVLLVFLVSGTATLGLLGAYGHPWEKTRSRVVLACIIAALGSLCSAALIVFLYRLLVSRLFIVLLAGISGIAFAAPRLAIRSSVLRRFRAGNYARNVVLVGVSRSTGRLGRHIRHHFSPSQYRVVGLLDVEPYFQVDRTGEEDDRAWPALKTELIRMVRENGVDEVVAVLPSDGGEWLHEVIRTCDEAGTHLRIVLEDFLGFRPVNIRTSTSESLGLLPSVNLTPQYTRNLEKIFVKRFMDLVVSACLLLLLAPVIAFLSLAVWLTSGRPVFYRWNVVGQNGKKIASYKFRTMVTNADELKQELERFNEMRGPVFKMKDDPRITPIGRVLRKFSLDELPQLYSVFKGDLSLVGPRPVSTTELKRFDFWHVRKLSVRSGITCLWQVSGRNDINDFNEWVKLDLEYIDNWSLWLDVKILMRTAWVVVAGTGR